MLYQYSDGNTHTDGLTLKQAREFKRLQNGGMITPMEKQFSLVMRVTAKSKSKAADQANELLNMGSEPDAVLQYDLLDAIEELRRYIRDEHKGEMVEALGSIGGLRRVRAILGLYAGSCRTRISKDGPCWKDWR